MNLLQDLRPAEIQIILSPQASEMKDFLKLTYLDLELRGVLKTQFEERASKSNRKSTTIPYVYVGDEFKKGSAFPHEVSMLDGFQKRQDIRYQLRNFVALTLENIANDRKFKRNYLVKSSRLRSYFNQNWFAHRLGQFSLNKQGLALQGELKKALQAKANELDQLKGSDEQRLTQELAALHGNVLFLEDYSHGLISKIKAALERVNIHDMGYRIIETWGYFEVAEYFFDSIYDSVEASMGCASDSGCDSGCSGCGGCGGCT